MTLPLDEWPWKIIGHLCMSSFVQYSKAIHEFKLELQSGNTKFWSKSVNFFPMWPRNLTDDLEKQYGTSYMLLPSFVHHFTAIGEFKLSYSPEMPKIYDFFVPLDLEIWWLTLKINKAPFICYFKLCVSFRSNRSIHTGATELILTQMYNAVWHD